MDCCHSVERECYLIPNNEVFPKMKPERYTSLFLYISYLLGMLASRLPDYWFLIPAFALGAILLFYKQPTKTP